MDETEKQNSYIRNLDLKFEGVWSNELDSLKFIVYVFYSILPRLRALKSLF